MGIGDLFGKKPVVCPECRSRGAVRTVFGRIRCRNRACKYYHESAAAEPLGPPERPSAGQTALRGTFDPGSHRVTVRYRNFRGEDAEYVGDRRTIRFRKAHVSLRVMPTGRRIALRQQFVQNLDELRREQADGPAAGTGPTPVERQILGYHRRHGTTSPRHEEVRRRYPDWTP